MITWNEYWEIKKQKEKGLSYSWIARKMFGGRGTQRSHKWSGKYLSALMKQMDKKAHPEKDKSVAEADKSFYKHSMNTIDQALNAFEKDHEGVRIHQYTEAEAKQLFIDHFIEQNRLREKSKQVQKDYKEPIPTYDGVQKPTGQTFTDPGTTAVGEVLNGSYKSDVYYPDCPIRQMKEITNALLDLRAEHDIKLKIFKSYIAEARNELCLKKS
jgi:hypothetical protein